MIKAVIFDLDNTLYNFDKGTKAGAEAFAAYCEKELGIAHDEALSGWKEAYKEQIAAMTDFCPAVHNRLIRAQIFLKKRGIKEIPHATRLAEAYWKGLIDAMVPEDGVEELMAAIKKKGLKIAVGTNMTSYVQHLKIEKLGFDKYVDCLISSEEAMAEKPTKEFFEYVLKRLDINADEAVFIGDSITHDMDGAATVDMNRAWYTKYPKKDDFAKADEKGIKNRIASYRDCLAPDGSIKFGDIEIV